MLVALMLGTGLGGGVVGGLAALALRGGGATVAATPLPPPAATPGESERLRDGIARILPTVVSVLVELPSQEVEGGVLERQNFGSGIVVSERGHILTNYHVVEGASRIIVALSTGEQREARLLDDDAPYHDLAVLQVEPQGLRVASFGDSERLAPGSPVAAVSGGLVGFENQVKAGVVSALNVDFPRPGIVLDDMIQTDASVNHGDSGGALVNVEGEVVGLLTTVVRQAGNGVTVEGVALAQPSNAIRPVIEAIVATGQNPRPRHGIERLDSQHVPITPQLAEAEGLPVSEGALIVKVAEGSPAAAAGVLAGDLVVGVNGVAVNNQNNLVDLLKALPGDKTADLFILRGGEQLVIRVTPQPREGARNG